MYGVKDFLVERSCVNDQSEILLSGNINYWNALSNIRIRILISKLQFDFYLMFESVSLYL